jgi:hypothetical protein
VTNRRAQGGTEQQRVLVAEALGRVMANPAYLWAVDVFMSAAVDMDHRRCGECGGELPEDVVLCAELDRSRTVLTFMARCEVHSATHDAAWQERQGEGGSVH